MLSRHLLRKLLLAATSAAAALLTAPTASADSLGVASDYNVFVLGNMSQSNVDAQGKVAVGGNATFNNYTVGSSLPSSSTNLLVNGDLTKTGGGTFHGNVLVNGNATLSNPSITGQLQVNGSAYINPNAGGSVAGGIVHNGSLTTPSYFAHTTPTSTGYTALPFSFADAANYLTSSSTFWGSLAANGTTASPYHNLTLTGADPSLNVFTVDAATLADANSLKISAPAGSTVLVNVTGPSANLSSMGISLLGGLDRQHVLYNFPTATTLNLSSIGLPGSVLAPRADVTFLHGNIDGTLIANNLTGSGEEHHSLFLGSLPSSSTTLSPTFVPAVPLPASAPAGAALLSLLALKRRRENAP